MIQDWYNEWKDMPEFSQEDLEPFKTIRVQFETQADVDAFAKLVGAQITPKTKGIWYPAHKRKHIEKVYVDES
jgi:hypothetical protein